MKPFYARPAAVSQPVSSSRAINLVIRPSPTRAPSRGHIWEHRGKGDGRWCRDTPYDAEAAGKARIATIGVLCGGFAESSLRQAGCVEVYPGPAALLALFEHSLLGK